MNPWPWPIERVTILPVRGVPLGSFGREDVIDDFVALLRICVGTSHSSYLRDRTAGCLSEPLSVVRHHHLGCEAGRDESMSSQREQRAASGHLANKLSIKK